MSSINFHTKEIAAKIVYYGPGLCGKTTSLQRIYSSIPEEKRPQIVSLATEVDRTIFFDFLPVTAYRIRDFIVRLQLYTVPGQVFYNATRKLVLNGVDGIVFVADSQRALRDSNLESLQNLEENLAELGLDIGEVPLVMQYNKRDLTDIHSLEEMDTLYNQRGVPSFGAVATTGQGLFEALKSVSQRVVSDLVRKGLGDQLANEEKKAPAEPKKKAAEVSSMAEAISKAAAKVEPTNPDLPLWPSRQVAELGFVLTEGLRAQNYAEVVLETTRLLEEAARAWVVSQGDEAHGGIPGFLLHRGVSGQRYRAWRRAVTAAKEGHAVHHADAVNALILALEASW